MRARRTPNSIASVMYSVLALLAGCIAGEGVPLESDAGQALFGDPSGGTVDSDAPLTSPSPEPQNAEPPCDDDGDCCPEGTTPVLGTQGADVFTTSTQGICHVTLGGSDVVNNTSAAGLHAALGGPGSDTLYGGFGPAILAGGDDGDTLTGRNADDELYGQGGNDNLYGNGGNDKGFGGEGNDNVSLGEGANEADGGPGSDTLNTGGGADVLRGGPDNDVLNAGGGADDLRGNSGDDTLNGQGGNDVLVGGPGKDIVNAGSGDDAVIVYDVCELVAGEVYNGEGGNDTLQIPVTLAEVQAFGVVVTSFENIVVEKHSCLSECVQPPDCHGHGECAEGPGQGQVLCDCIPGFAGPNCDAPEGLCVEGSGLPPLGAFWPDLADDDAVVVLDDPVIDLTIRNRANEDLEVSIGLAAFLDGALQEDFAGPSTIVAAGTDATIAVDFSSVIVGVDLQALSVSGRLTVKALGNALGGGPLRHQTYAPVLFLHTNSPEIVTYRRGALMSQFGGGDFSGQHDEIQQLADSLGVKLMGVGLSRPLDQTENDNGPPEIFVP